MGSIRACWSTPHIAGLAPDYELEVGELFRDNLRRYLDGRPLRNVVDRVLGDSMLSVERRREVHEYVRLRRSASVAELAEALGVSVQTVRRDLDDLEGEGVLERVHGGAVWVEGGRGRRPRAPAGPPCTPTGSGGSATPPRG